MKPIRSFVLWSALVAASALVVFGDKTPPHDIAEPVSRATVPTQSEDRAEPVQPKLLQIRDRIEIVTLQQEAGLFASALWNSPSLARTEASQPVELVGPPVPVMPPMPYTYLGKSLSGGQWLVFLARGNQTHVVSPAMVLDGNYRIDAIAPPWLKLTYLPLNLSQQIHIGDFN